jgi:hypothetical protein
VLQLTNAIREKLPVVQLFMNFPKFDGTQGSLPGSQKPYIGLYPEPDKSSPYHPIQNIQHPNYSKH